MAWLLVMIFCLRSIGINYFRWSSKDGIGFVRLGVLVSNHSILHSKARFRTRKKCQVYLTGCLLLSDAWDRAIHSLRLTRC
jgi:hypothetical protein